VQETLERAIFAITRGDVSIHGAGRTDTGVHALGQVAHFDTQSVLPIDRLEAAINAVLPRDVSVRDAREVDDRFHARFRALRRTYRYLIVNRPARSAVWDRYSAHIVRPLHVETMRSAAAILQGTHDFSSFANAVAEGRYGAIRELSKLSVRKVRASPIIVVKATSNGFLRSMVRNLVGLLIDVGHGQLDASDARAVLEAKERRRNPSATAPARGLCLMHVDYDESFGERALEPLPDDAA
jgi:tRNA pseudouridine38-40 synthase